MARRSALAGALLALSLAGLTGCVAAAIPVVAGATMVGTGKVFPKRSTAPAPSPVPSTSATPSSTVVRIAALPEPATDGAAGVAMAPATGRDPLGSLSRYVLAQSDPGRTQGQSALLAVPGALDASRAPCRSSARAIFIDLDPGRATFDPLAPGAPAAGLADALAAIRAQGLSVVWFSRLGENFAGAARAALTTTGLDPDRRDQIVLMRTIDERKQTRREALADFFCPVALVGDEKADFDELYLYLRSPDAAVMLDRLIGDGWFLIAPFPSPTSPENP